MFFTEVETLKMTVWAAIRRRPASSRGVSARPMPESAAVSGRPGRRSTAGTTRPNASQTNPAIPPIQATVSA